MKKTTLLWLLLLLPLAALAERVGVAPVGGSAIDPDEARVARSLLVNELQKASPQDLVAELDGVDSGGDESAIELLEAARRLAFDRLAIASVDRLGSKLILQVRLLDVNTERNLLADSTPLASMDDLDIAMRRAAQALAHRKPMSGTRQVGDVFQDEGLSTRTRETLEPTTLLAGYLYPSGSGYDGDLRRFTASVSHGIEDRNLAAGFTASWRGGPALLLYSDWLARTRDVCPFLGAAAGFHWARHEKFADDGSRDHGYDDGFHVALKSGLLLYRTYDFQLVLQLERAWTFNDHHDAAWLLTLGLRP